YWFHVHHLNTNSGKMSKSSGEFLTVSLLEEKGYNPLVYRFFCMQSHYRKSLVFSYENLDNAAAAYNKLTAKIAGLLPEKNGEIQQDKLDEILGGFRAALDNDLNTSLAVTALYDALKAEATAATKLKAIAEMDRVLSLGLIEAAEKSVKKEDSADEIPAEVKELLEKRAEARKAKNFALADEIRAQITALGYTVEETRQGTVVKPVAR
ncbi:MAG: cysteine--tRNA ligase, partial [Ruminiclostridium sp.]